MKKVAFLTSLAVATITGPEVLADTYDFTQPNISPIYTKYAPTGRNQQQPLQWQTDMIGAPSSNPYQPIRELKIPPNSSGTSTTLSNYLSVTSSQPWKWYFGIVQLPASPTNYYETIGGQPFQGNNNFIVPSLYPQSTRCPDGGFSCSVPSSVPPNTESLLAPKIYGNSGNDTFIVTGEYTKIKNVSIAGFGPSTGLVYGNDRFDARQVTRGLGGWGSFTGGAGSDTFLLGEQYGVVTTGFSLAATDIVHFNPQKTDTVNQQVCVNSPVTTITGYQVRNGKRIPITTTQYKLSCNTVSQPRTISVRFAPQQNDVKLIISGPTGTDQVPSPFLFNSAYQFTGGSGYGGQGINLGKTTFCTDLSQVRVSISQYEVNTQRINSTSLGVKTYSLSGYPSTYLPTSVFNMVGIKPAELNEKLVSAGWTRTTGFYYTAVAPATKPGAIPTNWPASAYGPSALNNTPIFVYTSPASAYCPTP